MRETGRGQEAEFLGGHGFYRQFEINDVEFTAEPA
jgi:hypothetical protein